MIIFPLVAKSLLYGYFWGMGLANNIKSIREQRGLLQKQVAEHIGVDKSTYSKIEGGSREVTVKELQKMAGLFNTSIDQIVNYEGGLPEKIVIGDKSDLEQLALIKQLDKEDRQTVFHIINKMLTNQKFQKFFEQNLNCNSHYLI